MSKSHTHAPTIPDNARILPADAATDSWRSHARSPAGGPCAGRASEYHDAPNRIRSAQARHPNDSARSRQFAQPVVLDHHKTGVDFGMAGQILGSGMDDDVGTLVERQLQIRGNECVVDNGNRTIAMSDFSNLRHIVDLQQRIGKNFEIHGLRRTTMRGSLGGVPGNSGIKRFVVGGFTAPVLLSLTGSPWTS